MAEGFKRQLERELGAPEEPSPYHPIPQEAEQGKYILTIVIDLFMICVYFCSCSYNYSFICLFIICLFHASSNGYSYGRIEFSISHWSRYIVFTVFHAVPK